MALSRKSVLQFFSQISFIVKMQSVNLEFSPTPPDSPESIEDVSLPVDGKNSVSLLQFSDFCRIIVGFYCVTL